MLWNAPPIASGDDGVVEIIIAVFAVLFWVLKAAAGSVSAVKARQQRQNQVTTPAAATARAKLPAFVQLNAAQRQQGRGKVATKQPPRRPITPPPLPPTAGVMQSATALPPPLGAVASDITTGRRAVTRAAETAQLIRPGSLRTQFILTELLQPPISLRADREV